MVYGESKMLFVGAAPMSHAVGVFTSSYHAAHDITIRTTRYNNTFEQIKEPSLLSIVRRCLINLMKASRGP